MSDSANLEKEDTWSEIQPLIHIGYAKAASTWVQSAFAEEGSGFYFPYFHEHIVFAEPIVFPHPLKFDPETRREEIMSLIRPAAETENIPVISTERLAGHWFSGGYDTRLIADRLNTMFPEGRVLIIIREQKSMINSVYRQYVKKGGGRSVEEFLFPPPSGRGRGPGFSFTFFEYDLIIEYYRDLFDSENVLAVPLGVLKSDASEFFDTIVDFAGASTASDFSPPGERANVGISAFDASLRRPINPVFSRDFVNDYSTWYHPFLSRNLNRARRVIKRTTPQSVKDRWDKKLEQRIDELVGDRYHESNRRTDDLIPFDLEELGWEL